MSVEVSDLAKRKERKTNLSQGRGGSKEIADRRRTRRQCRGLSKGAWGIGPVSDVQTSQKPVMSTILEDVRPWHGARTESMDKDCLKFALYEVQDHDCHGELLEIGWRRDLGRAEGGVWVDVGSQDINGRVYEDWA